MRGMGRTGQTLDEALDLVEDRDNASKVGPPEVGEERDSRLQGPPPERSGRMDRAPFLDRFTCHGSCSIAESSTASIIQMAAILVEGGERGKGRFLMRV